MIDTEIVPQNHLDGFEVQRLVGHVDVGKVYHRDIPHKFLMVMADFEVRKVCN